MQTVYFVQMCMVIFKPNGINDYMEGVVLRTLRYSKKFDSKGLRDEDASVYLLCK